MYGRLLEILVVYLMDPVSDHGGVFTSATGERFLVAQYHALQATSVDFSLLESLW